MVPQGGSGFNLMDASDDLLDLMTKPLGAIDYLIFGCVCKRWRSYVAEFRQKFMASQPSLVVLLSPYARKYCYFYSTFDQSLYKVKLPDLVGKRCSRVCCGYFVMEDQKKELIPRFGF